MATPIYVPILKGKEGEYAALEALAEDVSSLLMPLIEIPPVPYDFSNDRRAKSLDEHIVGVSERLFRCWQRRPLYLDLPWFGESELLSDGRLAIDAVLAECRQLNVGVIPVVSRLSSPEYLTIVGSYAAARNSGVCIRLLMEDFEEEIDLESEIARILSGINVLDATSTDLLIDLEDLGPVSSTSVLITRSVFSMLPPARAEEWRRIIFAASSFPEDLSNVDAATTRTLPRLEWDLWIALQRRANLLPRRNLIFGDYSISHPDLKELDPRTMRMSANIRYTARDNWLVVKGRNVRQFGFDQYFELCKILVNRPEYCGASFSWGDGFIADCASESRGPGNATTWRKVGVNHHLTLLVRELSSQRGA